MANKITTPNIKLHPEHFVVIPGLGHENDIREIICQYTDNCLNSPDWLKHLSFDCEHIEDSINRAQDYIEDASFRGDIYAEKAYMELDNILEDYFYPNYFMIQDSLDYHQQAIKKCDVYAMGMMGDKYFYGKQVEQDYDKAFSWYLKAAEYGVSQAEYNVGGCYETGCGVERDIEKAVYWYKRALAKGIYEAEKCLDRIDKISKHIEFDSVLYLSENMTDSEEKSNITDEYGVKYSINGKRLLEVPKDIEHYTIKPGTLMLCSFAFNDCEKLGSIEIPNGVKIIGSRCFYGCSNLKHVKIPDSVIEISDYAFSCTGLEHIEIPDNVTIIRDKSFAFCTNLKSVIIGKGVSKFEGSALRENENLKSIIVDKDNPYYDSREGCNAVIETSTKSLLVGCKKSIVPDTVTRINEEAFIHSNIESITLGNDVEVIEQRAFLGCKSLKNVRFSKALREIGDEAFFGCESLETLYLHDGLKKIGNEAFMCALNLKEVHLPDTVDCIKRSAFSECISLETINIPRNIKKLSHGAFFRCEALSSVILPEGLKIIEEHAFSCCEKLTKIVVPVSVELIEGFNRETYFSRKSDMQEKSYSTA